MKHGLTLIGIFILLTTTTVTYALDPFVPEADYFHRMNPWPMASGTSALFGNPATLANSTQQAIRLQGNESWLGYSQYEAQGLLATDLASIALGGLIWSASDIPMVSRADNGRPQIDGQTSHQLASFSLAGGLDLLPSLSAGVAAVYHSQNLAGATSQGYGVELGLAGMILPQIRLGVYTQNLFHSGLKWTSSDVTERFSRYLGTSAEIFAGPLKVGVFGLGSKAKVVGHWRPISEWALWLGASTLDTRQIRLDYWNIGTELDLGSMTVQYQYQVSNQFRLVATQHTFATTFMLGKPLQLVPTQSHRNAPVLAWVPLSEHHEFPFASELAEVVLAQGFVMRPVDVLLNYRQVRNIPTSVFYQPDILAAAADDLGIDILVYWDWASWAQFRKLRFKLLYTPTKTWYAAELDRDNDEAQRHAFFQTLFKNLYNQNFP